MKARMFSKALAVAIILLFLGLAIQPSIAVQSDIEIDVEPKDYLFQTILDFANNPDVKNLLEQYKYDLFEINIDRSIYRKHLLRNPRLMFNMLFTKPTMTIEYLNRCYNNGIEISNIIGEDKVLEIMENIESTDTKWLDELNNIITNDEELSSRLETLKEMNKEQDSDSDITPICSIILILIFWNFGKVYLYEDILESIYNSYPFISIFFYMIYFLIVLESYIILFPLGILWDIFDCYWDIIEK